MNINKLTFTTLVLLLIVTLQGCASKISEVKYDPEGQINQLLSDLNVDFSKDINCHGATGSLVNCEKLIYGLEELSIRYPHNPKIKMVLAVAYYQSGRFIDSQLILDQLLAQPWPNPEAAILRSQISLLDGNINPARSLLKKQLQLVPDHAELYSALAATYYMEGRYEKSMVAIRTADRLGGKSWRVAFHLGLLHEAEQQWYLACEQYGKVIQLQPNHTGALSRLVQLSSRDSCIIPAT